VPGTAFYDSFAVGMKLKAAWAGGCSGRPSPSGTKGERVIFTRFGSAAAERCLA